MIAAAFENFQFWILDPITKFSSLIWKWGAHYNPKKLLAYKSSGL